MTITRRSFIQITGAATAATAIGVGPSLLAQPHARAEFDPETDGDHVVPTFCEMCFWKCGVLAHVKEGRITKIVGNPAHPLSRGRLCPRGTGGTGLIYDPDRLRSPLIRRDARGTQSFEEVSWESALDHTAEKMLEIKRRYGPEALAYFAHGYGGSWFGPMMRGYGTDTHGAPSNGQCRGARAAGYELTFGTPVGAPEPTDMDNARVIVLLGSHIGENMHNTQVQWFSEAVARGADVIVVDPRFSTAAGKARHWLPIRPGTDVALLLAWMHVIIEERLYDADYLERYAIGFDQLKAHVADKTPAWASPRTGLSVEQIVETARLMGGGAPATVVHPGRHTAWYGDDTQRARAMAMLTALLGSYGRRGGIYFSASMDVPPGPAVPPYPEARANPDHPTGVVFPFAGPEGSADGLRDASIPGAHVDYPVKGWFVYGSNMLQSLPQPRKTIQALEALDFVLSIDVIPNDITGWADVVLPESVYLERYDDLHAPAFREPYVALRQPVVQALEGTKPGWWIAKELAARLDLSAYTPWGDDVEGYLDTRLRGMGHSLDEMKVTGVIQGEPQPVYIEDGIEPEFDTPSGKIELFSQQLADAGLSPMPEYRAHEQPPDGQFRLLFGRTPTQTFGRSTNNRFLGRVYDHNKIWVNQNRATELGLASGDLVKVTNQDGIEVGPIEVRATQAIRPDCVFMVHGYGHRDPRLRFGHGRGADDNQLVSRVSIDPEMGGTGMFVNFVSLERVES